MTDLFTVCLHFSEACLSFAEPHRCLMGGAIAGTCLSFARKGKKKKKRKARTHRRRLIKSAKVAEKLAEFLTNTTTRSTLRAILLSRDRADIWNWLVATPPGSVLETILAEYRQKTPVALELVFMSWVSLMAQFLAENGARVRCGSQLIRLDLYTVVLATSGAMKSWSYSRMVSALKRYWTPNVLLDAGSTAGLIAQLKKNDGKAALWRLEEFGEFWRELSKESHAGTKRVLLMNYDGDPIGRGLKDESVVVDEPYLSIFGTTVTANLAEQISASDWRSGMCQRICFVLAPEDQDPTRSWKNPKFAILNVDEEKIAREFSKLLATPVHPVYEFSEEAIAEIEKCWAMIGEEGSHEFVRRVEFRAFKYAVVYHWMLRKQGAVLDAEDVGWAFRLAMLHLADLRVLLDSTEYADFEDLLRRGEEFRLKCLRDGKPFRPRELQMRLSRSLRSIEEAKSLFVLVCERACQQAREGVPDRDEIFELTGIEPALRGSERLSSHNKTPNLERNER